MYSHPDTLTLPSHTGGRLNIISSLRSRAITAVCATLLATAPGARSETGQRSPGTPSGSQWTTQPQTLRDLSQQITIVGPGLGRKLSEYQAKAPTSRYQQFVRDFLKTEESMSERTKAKIINQRVEQTPEKDLSGAITYALEGLKSPEIRDECFAFLDYMLYQRVGWTPAHIATILQNAGGNRDVYDQLAHKMTTVGGMWTDRILTQFYGELLQKKIGGTPLLTNLALNPHGVGWNSQLAQKALEDGIFDASSHMEFGPPSSDFRRCTVNIAATKPDTFVWVTQDKKPTSSGSWINLKSTHPDGKYVALSDLQVQGTSVCQMASVTYRDGGLAQGNRQFVPQIVTRGPQKPTGPLVAETTPRRKYFDTSAQRTRVNYIPRTSQAQFVTQVTPAVSRTIETQNRRFNTILTSGRPYAGFDRGASKKQANFPKPPTKKAVHAGVPMFRRW